MERISDHISWWEATKSPLAVRWGIDNTPNKEQIDRMKVVAAQVFEPLRDWYGKPIGISSFFRGKQLNSVVGGAVASQHMDGTAIDIDADIFDNGITNKQIFDYIRTYLDFDQLIAEFMDSNGNPAWVHVSYVSLIANRHHVLRADKINGYTQYRKYED